MPDYGPVDVLVTTLANPAFDGRVLASIERLTSSGAIRVVDAMILLMEQDGSVRGLDVEDVGPKDAALLGYRRLDGPGLFDSASAEHFTEGMTPGSVVIAVAFENTWQTTITDSLKSVGAEMCLWERLKPDAVHQAFGATGWME